MRGPFATRSRRFRIGVGFLVAPVIILGITVGLWVLVAVGSPPLGLLLPVLTFGFVIEVVSGTIGVWLILTSPDLQPWRTG